jgi:hypothetical protein
LDKDFNNINHNLPVHTRSFKNIGGRKRYLNREGKDKARKELEDFVRRAQQQEAYLNGVIATLEEVCVHVTPAPIQGRVEE